MYRPKSKLTPWKPLTVRGSSCVLVLLDLPAAFETLDHTILLQRPRTFFGIRGTELAWFVSYLSQRSQCVVIGAEHPDPVCLKFSVPQGSVPGPLIYSLYTMPLGKQVQSQEIDHHFYADDSQLYNVFKSVPAEVSRTVSSMGDCLEPLRKWMADNKLKVNDNKTEIVIHSPPGTNNLRS